MDHGQEAKNASRRARRRAAVPLGDQAVAYRLSLLDAGVALQTLYLVATQLGLACAAAGSGDPRIFARLTGRSSCEETSIAEFGFGRAPSHDQT